MTDKPPIPPTPTPDSKSPSLSSTSKSTTKPASSRPAYISGGQVLASPPLTARLTTLANDTYNFLGLYVTSLFSLDPYAAAQNSTFNTRGPGRISNQARARWGAGGPSSSAGSGGSSGSGPRGGGGGGGGSGRRLGTVDDVRGPECGSCG